MTKRFKIRKLETGTIQVWEAIDQRDVPDENLVYNSLVFDGGEKKFNSFVQVCVDFLENQERNPKK